MSSSSTSPPSQQQQQYAFPDLKRFSSNLSLLSTVIRAQYLFRTNRKAYQLRAQAKRNKQRRTTERDWQTKLANRLAEKQNQQNMFDAEELAKKARSMEAEQQAKRDAQAVLAQRRASIPVLNSVHAAVVAAYEEKKTRAREDQMKKCQQEFLNKLQKKQTSAETSEKAQTGAIIRERAANPALAQLGKELREKGEAVSLRSEGRAIMARRKASVIITNLNAEIVRPDNAQRLKSVVASQQQQQEEDMLAKIKRGSRRATGSQPLDFSQVDGSSSSQHQADEVRMD